MEPYQYDLNSLTSFIGGTPEVIYLAVLLFLLFYIILGLVSLFSEKRSLRLLISLAFTLVVVANSSFMSFFVPFVKNLIFFVAVIAIILFFAVLLRGRKNRRNR